VPWEDSSSGQGGAVGTCQMTFKGGDMSLPPKWVLRIEAIRHSSIKGEQKSYLVHGRYKGDRKCRVQADMPSW